jgi:hypothetical protein
MKSYAAIFLCISLFLTACDKTTTPSFVHVEGIDLSVSPNFQQGTNDHGIRDAWFYLNDNLVGIYELPATIPVIAEGEQKITVIAGVLNNGIQTARITYPFYRQYVTNLNLVPGETIDFSGSAASVSEINGFTSPVVTYFEELTFWNERFEDAGTQFQPTSQSLADIQITQDPAEVFNYNPSEGSSGSGRISLTGENSYFEIRSSHTFNPPTASGEIYLEMNYLTPCSLQVGVYQNSPVVQKVYGKGILPNENWSKIYIDLTPEVRGQVNGTSFSIFIEGILSSGQTNGTVLIDNVKLIYPE